MQGARAELHIRARAGPRLVLGPGFDPCNTTIMHYKVRTVKEVDNRTLHRCLEMPGRPNAFTLMATNSPTNLSKQLRSSLNRCTAAWDMSDICMTISNDLDRGTVTNRLGETLKTCVVLDAATASKCFATPYLLADDIKECCEEMVADWNLRFSTAKAMRNRGVSSREITLANRVWVDSFGKTRKSDIVVIMDTFRFVREIQTADREVAMELDDVDVVLKYRSSEFITERTKPKSIHDGMAYMSGGLRCNVDDCVSLLQSKELMDCLRHCEELLKEERKEESFKHRKDSTYIKTRSSNSTTKASQISYFSSDDEEQEEEEEEEEEGSVPPSGKPRNLIQGGAGPPSSSDSEEGSTEGGDDKGKGEKEKVTDPSEKKDSATRAKRKKIEEDSDSDTDVSDLDHPEDYVPVKRRRENVRK